MKNKLRIPVVLMVLTIAVIVIFQSYWINKNYREEKKLFTIRTNLLFRETMFRLQASKLNLAANTNIKIQDKEGIISMTNVLQEKIRDTVFHKTNVQSAVTISMNPANHLFQNDTSIKYRIRSPMPEIKVFDFLVGIDSLQDSIHIKELIAKYQEALLKENINVPFTIIKEDSSVKQPLMPPDPEDNKVTIGFTHPTNYHLNIYNESWYLFKKLWQPILVSLFLVGATIFSFLLLYGNLVKQRRLIAIKNDFINNITHELKTPIATVSVAIEAMKNFNALDDPKRTKEYLDISENELQRLSLLVDKVLKLSMFENKEITLQKESFDLRLLAEEVVISMRLQFEKQKATTKLETQGENFIIEADKLHMTSVLYNLLDNALKYSREDPHIVVKIIDHTRFIEIQVMDNGIGIAAEFKRKIFEQFFRVPSGDRHNIKGYGLGLSYVSHIVASHQGFIEVESELGKGSTFSVKMPFKEASIIIYDKGRKLFKKSIKL